MTDIYSAQEKNYYQNSSSATGFINDRIYSNTRKNDILMVVMSKEMAETNKEALTELVDQLRTPLVIVPANDAPHN